VPTDWGSVALDLGRKKFVQRYLHPFLFSTQATVAPTRPMRTEKLDRTDLIRLSPQGAQAEVVVGPRVVAVVKTQPAFPSMITIGRTNNNDVVISDVQVSKFHAYFKSENGALLLEEAGSSNGTWVDGKQLHKGSPVTIVPGTLLRFAAVEMELVDPDTCWKRLIDALDPW
jgi:hypothetical protein